MSDSNATTSRQSSPLLAWVMVLLVVNLMATCVLTTVVLMGQQGGLGAGAPSLGQQHAASGSPAITNTPPASVTNQAHQPANIAENTTTPVGAEAPSGMRLVGWDRLQSEPGIEYEWAEVGSEMFALRMTVIMGARRRAGIVYQDGRDAFVEEGDRLHTKAPVRVAKVASGFIVVEHEGTQQTLNIARDSLSRDMASGMTPMADSDTGYRTTNVDGREIVVIGDQPANAETSTAPATAEGTKPASESSGGDLLRDLKANDGKAANTSDLVEKVKERMGLNGEQKSSEYLVDRLADNEWTAYLHDLRESLTSDITLRDADRLIYPLGGARLASVGNGEYSVLSPWTRQLKLEKEDVITHLNEHAISSAQDLVLKLRQSDLFKDGLVVSFERRGADGVASVLKVRVQPNPDFKN